MSTETIERQFTKTHEWVLPLDEETVLVGITDHAQELLGDVVFIELPEVGRLVHSAEEIAVVESVKAAADIYAPVTGQVLEVNQHLLTTPESVNQDPYGAGWLFKIKVTDEATLNTLVDEAEYLNWLKS